MTCGQPPAVGDDEWALVDIISHGHISRPLYHSFPGRRPLSTPRAGEPHRERDSGCSASG